jgi:hypothetical protein
MLNCAMLNCAMLNCAMLSCAMLSCAMLNCARLNCARLNCTNPDDDRTESIQVLGMIKLLESLQPPKRIITASFLFLKLNY